MLLLAVSLIHMAMLLEIVEKYGLEMEIKLNGDKTQLMIVNQKRTYENDLVLNGMNLELVDQIKYLGVYIQNKYKCNSHIDERIKKVTRALYSLNSIGINNNNLSIKTKIRMFGTYLRPVFLYGMDTLSLSSTMVKELETFENNLIKNIIGISKCCHNTALLLALRINKFSNTLMINKLKLFLRLISNEFTRNVMVCRLQEPLSNSIVFINDLLKDIWTYIENDLDENFNLEELTLVVKSKIKYG